MFRCVGLLVSFAVSVAAAPALSDTAISAANASVIRADTHKELNEKFCAASPDQDHIFVLPASLFVDSQEVICGSGPYKLYRIIENDDTDDFEYFLDPPFGAENRLGCDGKAGRHMPIIAINCRPE